MEVDRGGVKSGLGASYLRSHDKSSANPFLLGFSMVAEFGLAQIANADDKISLLIVWQVCEGGFC